VVAAGAGRAGRRATSRRLAEEAVRHAGIFAQVVPLAVALGLSMLTLRDVFATEVLTPADRNWSSPAQTATPPYAPSPPGSPKAFHTASCSSSHTAATSPTPNNPTPSPQPSAPSPPARAPGGEATSPVSRNVSRESLNAALGSDPMTPLSRADVFLEGPRGVVKRLRASNPAVTLTHPNNQAPTQCGFRFTSSHQRLP